MQIYSVLKILKHKLRRNFYMSKSLQFKQNKILLPKLDVIFQAIFGEVGSERITKKFLESCAL